MANSYMAISHDGSQFPYNGCHRPSKTLANDISFDFLLDPSIATDHASSGGDGARWPAGFAHESHDDLCVDACTGVGLYNGSEHFGHRGAQGSMPLRPWQSLQRQQQQQQPSLDHQHTGFHAGPANSMQFRDFFTSPSSPSCSQWYGQQQLPMNFHGTLSDEECHSIADSCCDSQCTMTGKCTDVACAATDDACTDQNCPERPAAAAAAATTALPTEVVNGAAALISINHAPEQQQSQPPGNFLLQPSGMDDMGFGLPHTSQPSFQLPPDLLPSSLGTITSHLLAAHSDPNSTACMRPCPLDDPSNYQHCHFPHMDDIAPLFTNYDGSMPDWNLFQSVPECGAEIHDPEAFLRHFNAQHRPLFISGISGMQNTLASETMLPSTEVTSPPPPPTPFDTPDSGPSTKEASPLTPRSSAREVTEWKSSGASSARNTPDVSVPGSPTAMDVDYEHRCLWCEEGSSVICGQTFADSDELFNHAVGVHIKHAQKGVDGFRCGWANCQRGDAGTAGFPQRSKIERHMQTHVGHKPHVCPTCKKGFSARQALTQHMLIHSDEKPLECEICHKKFRHPSALIMHQRTHTGEKPLKCPECGKCFSESSNLSKHKRTHDLKGRFTCSVPGCKRNFHRQDQLRRHMRTHQRIAADSSATNSGGQLSIIYETAVSS
ncbi:zinc-responsive transcriptional regulator ZAP1 [Diplogelasinospora grovesii]|uniref:Zinc-responsive transcriptional regulator ZAP1 n=1 Tax=Diplogelasinospora grovesii TaxID=303347 RepID=A0AAN6RZS6_9PEZI|nr:zinc-responsive transcriptional regulator ZAP1 [Diplogelasinospora grovesii]